VITYIWKATTAKRMEIDPYCQRQNCSPLNVFFFHRCIDFVDIARRSPARGYNYITPRRAGLSPTVGLSCLSLSLSISKTSADMAKVTVNDKYEVTYGLSIDTKIDDLELL